MARSGRVRLRRFVLLMTLSACLLAPGAAGVTGWAQTPEPGDLQAIPDAQNTVEQLVESLESHRLTPAQALDPAMDDTSRQRQLSHFRNSGFVIEIDPATPVATGTDGFASMQAGFRLRDGMATRARFDATLQFVQRGDRWYFANYNFLDIGSYLVRVLTGLAIVAALLGLLVWSLLRRSRQKDPMPLRGTGTEVPGGGLPAIPPEAPSPGSRDAGFHPQGFAPGAQVPLVTGLTPRVDEALPTPGVSAADSVAPGSGSDADRGRTGWQPEVQPAHPQTTAYPVAPARYDLGWGAPRQGSVPGPQPARDLPLPVDANLPLEPGEQTGGQPQTTAYPEAPPRYDGEASDPKREILGPQAGGEPAQLPKPPTS